VSALDVAGDYSRLPFALLVELRALAGHQRAYVALSVLSIALAVAMATGLEMTTRSVGLAVDGTAAARIGAADLEVANGTLGIPEALLDEVAGVPGVRAAAPVIERTFWLTDARVAGEALDVLGIDFVAERGVHDLQVTDGVRIVDPLQLIAGNDSVVIAASLAQQAGTSIGGKLRVRDQTGEHVLVVRGILAAGGLADAYNGQVAVMDVLALQSLAGQSGVFDRVNVALEAGADAVEVKSQLSARIAGRANVGPPSGRNEELDAAMATLRVAAGTFALVAILIAVLVAYGTASTSIQRRIPEIALLRAAGLGRAGVQQLVWIDALLVAMLGTMLGLGLGLVSARSFTNLFSRVIQFHESRAMQPLGPAPLTFAIGSAVGMLVSAIGTIPPARRAARVAPLDLLDGTHPHLNRPPARFTVVLGLGAAAVALALALVPLGLPSAPRVALLMAAALLALAAAATPALRHLVRWLVPLLERVAPSVGQLTGVSILGRLPSVRISTVAVAGMVASVTVVFVVVESMAGSMDAWGQRFWGGGIYIMVGSDSMTVLREVLSHETVQRIRETPGVDRLQESFPTEANYQGEPIYLNAFSSASWVERRAGDWLSGDPAAVAGALARGEVAISDGFARHFGVKSGDSIELATPSGPQRFVVGGVFRDVLRGAGGVVLDVAEFDRHWPRSGAWRVVVWSHLAPEEVIARIRAGVRERQALLFIQGEQLRRHGTEIVRPYLGFMWLIATLMCLLGGLSVMAAQLGVVLDRRRELALLRAAGATPRQVLVLVVLDATVVAAFAALAGTLLGLVSGWPGLEIYGDNFKVNLDYHAHPLSAALLMLGAVVAAVLGGLYPAWRAGRVQPTEALARE
jgi:putative ABC transport system permease protein